MRYIFSLIVLLILPLSALPQTTASVTRSGIVKDVVGTIAGSKKKNVEVILNDLREFRGKIVAVYDDFFVLEPRKIKTSFTIKVISVGSVPNTDTRRHIKYHDVLQIGGKNAAVSFVPDPTASPYSTWDGVNALVTGDFVQLHRSSGGKTHGVYLRSTADSLSLMRGNHEVVIPAAEITKVYHVKGDTRSLAAKILTGGTLGAELKEDGLPIWDAVPSGDPLGIVVGAAVSASVGITFFVLSIGKTQRALIYSK
ncbi:MAG: hypothetical protein ACJ72Z_13415 [Pyrinomonadaceae bacterium]